MPLIAYYIIFATIMLVAVISTILVGISKKNKEGNPQYDTKTKGNWSRLSWIYIFFYRLRLRCLDSVYR